MRAIDTNILVRYVAADDDAAQSESARRLIDEVCSAADPALAGPVVLAEFVWVLRSRYRTAKAAIVSSLDALSRNPHIAF